jgi:hypothetical protein
MNPGSSSAIAATTRRLRNRRGDGGFHVHQRCGLQYQWPSGARRFVTVTFIRTAARQGVVASGTGRQTSLMGTAASSSPNSRIIHGIQGRLSCINTPVALRCEYLHLMQLAMGLCR